MAGVGTTPALTTCRTFTGSTVGELRLNPPPDSRVSRPTRRRGDRRMLRQGPNQSGAEPADRRRIERMLAGDGANAVGAKEAHDRRVSVWHW